MKIIGIIIILFGCRFFFVSPPAPTFPNPQLYPFVMALAGLAFIIAGIFLFRIKKADG